jgi:hypothetical protein
MPAHGATDVVQPVIPQQRDRSAVRGFDRSEVNLGIDRPGGFEELFHVAAGIHHGRILVAKGTGDLLPVLEQPTRMQIIMNMRRTSRIESTDPRRQFQERSGQTEQLGA